MVALSAVAASECQPGGFVEGRYQIIRKLADGGMGTVFLAEHVLIRRRVALKLLHAELATDGSMVRRFMNEASAAGTLGHPHIVESTDMGFTSNGVPYIVFEYLEGCQLSEEIYRLGGLPVPRALHIASQIASALDAAHSAKIVHLDLKSDNVFLIERGESLDHVKVLDFGISRFLEVDLENNQRGVLAGTPEFMAPEQVTMPDLVDGRADIYALGVLLYEMLTGRCPFTSSEPRVLLQRLVNEPVPALGRPVPPELERLLVDRLLAKSRDDRLQTMREVKSALDDLAIALRTRSTDPSLFAFDDPSKELDIGFYDGPIAAAARAHAAERAEPSGLRSRPTGAYASERAYPSERAIPSEHASASERAERFRLRFRPDGTYASKRAYPSERAEGSGPRSRPTGAYASERAYPAERAEGSGPRSRPTGAYASERAYPSERAEPSGLRSRPGDLYASERAYPSERAEPSGLRSRPGDSYASERADTSERVDATEHAGAVERADAAEPARVTVLEPTPEPAAAHAPEPARARRARLAPRPWWLVAAMLAGVAGGTLWVAEREQATELERAARTALDGDAANLATMLAIEARAAHERVYDLASSPIVRAAIETNAAPVADLAADGRLFRARRGEELELVQRAGGRRVLLRDPKAGQPLVTTADPGTRLVVDSSRLRVIASAPVNHPSGELGGVLALAVPIDLARIERLIREHALAATLVGLDQPLVIVEAPSEPPPALTGTPTGTPAGTPVVVSIGLDRDAGGGELSLVVHTEPPGPNDGLGELRRTSWEVGGALLVVYAFGWLGFAIRGRAASPIPLS